SSWQKMLPPEAPPGTGGPVPLRADGPQGDLPEPLGLLGGLDLELSSLAQQAGHLLCSERLQVHAHPSRLASECGETVPAVPRLHLLQHQADRAKGRVRPGRGWRARWWFHGRHERDICIAGNRQPSVPVTEAVDALSLLAKVDGELCEVAIGRNDAEA